MVESKFKWSSSSTADDAALVKSVASTIRRDMLALMSGFSRATSRTHAVPSAASLARAQGKKDESIGILNYIY